MTLSARAIALQGIGLPALLVALQGLVPTSEAVAAPQSDSPGGGVVSSATISMSEWLRLAKKRPVEALEAKGAPTQQANAADALEAAPATRTKRRRREEELFILMRLP